MLHFNIVQIELGYFVLMKRQKDDIEIKEEPTECPARFDIGVEMREMVEKINMLAKKELSIRKKQSTITNYFKEV